MRFFRKIRLAIMIFLGIFIFPALVSLAWWQVQDRPTRWNQADWSSSGMLPDAADVTEAVIHVMAARTGGLKGAFSVHSWLVTKETGAAGYTRYDKVGWGRPVRVNAYAADARWYSNDPFIVKTVRGPEAAKLIPRIEQAVANYPHTEPSAWHAGKRGGYRIWPGPNSNSFVAYVLREVPEIGAVLPSNAVGRDYLAEGGVFHFNKDAGEMKISLGGLAGITAGWTSGLEVNLFTLVAGISFADPGIKLPGIGEVSFSGVQHALARNVPDRG